MPNEGRFYSDKVVQPPVITYLEEHFTNFIEYIENMSSLAASFLEQTCPIIMNREQTLTTVAGDKDFIPSNSVNGIPTGLISEDISRLLRAELLIIGRVVNIYNGRNYLDCSTPTHNQWQINVDGGAYADLQNATKADGQMQDTDWECYVQGVIHPFTLMFDITSLITSVNNRFGIRLQNGRSIHASLIVTIDIFSKYVWKL